MAETVYITPDRVRFSAGKFDSNNYYLRSGSSGSDFPMVRGRSIEIRVSSGPVGPVWVNDTTATREEYRRNEVGNSSFSAVATTVKTK